MGVEGGFHTTCIECIHRIAGKFDGIKFDSLASNWVYLILAEFKFDWCCSSEL